MVVMAARSSWRSMSLSYSTVTSLPWTISRAKRLSRPMAVPAGRTEVRSRVAPRGVVSLPVPWKFRPVMGFWNSVSLSILTITSPDTSRAFIS